jgi:hypothetical protein
LTLNNNFLNVEFLVNSCLRAINGSWARSLSLIVLLCGFKAAHGGVHHANAFSCVDVCKGAGTDHKCYEDGTWSDPGTRNEMQGWSRHGVFKNTNNIPVR